MLQIVLQRVPCCHAPLCGCHRLVQCVAVCCSVLQCVLQLVAVCVVVYASLSRPSIWLPQVGAVYCSVLQCVLQLVAVCIAVSASLSRPSIWLSQMGGFRVPGLGFRFYVSGAYGCCMRVGGYVNSNYFFPPMFFLSIARIS